MKKEIKIANKKIGDSHPCFVIAEAGSNHNGKLSQAKRLVDIAKEAKADAVKFQYFRAKDLYPEKSGQVQYLKKLGIKKSIFEIIKEMEIPLRWTVKLAKYCKTKKIIFFASVFSEKEVDVLNPYVPAFKIASYELTHIPLIKYAAKKGKPLIISTGASQGIKEIRATIEAVKNAGNNQVCLMQCTAKYPAPVDTINAKVVQTLKKEFHLPVGLSDHSLHSLYGAAAAIAAGADLYEKHFTLSRKMKGPDHSFAIEPKELRECVALIRNVEIALGTGKKKLQKVEKELSNYRRSIYTTKRIKRGELFSIKNTKILRRPGISKKGVRPADYEQVLGKKSKRSLPIFTLLQKKDIS